MKYDTHVYYKIILRPQLTLSLTPFPKIVYILGLMVLENWPKKLTQLWLKRIR